MAIDLVLSGGSTNEGNSSFLPLMIMEREKLVEKHAKASGLPELKAS